MAIIKAKSFIHEYKLRAKDNDISSLSGRKGRDDMTNFISQNIFNSLTINKDDTILDIGCGDSTLLRMIDKKHKVFSLIGTLPSDEEIKRLEKEISFKNCQNKIHIFQGLSHKIPIEDNSIDKIILNGVLILLNEETVNLTLLELSRVSKKGTIVYIGETPFLNEFSEKSYGNSIIKWLFYGLKHRGFKYFYRSLKSVIKSIFFGEQMILGIKQHYYASVDHFINKAKEYNLELIETFPQKILDIDGKVIESQTRQDYIFKII